MEAVEVGVVVVEVEDEAEEEGESEEVVVVVSEEEEEEEGEGEEETRYWNRPSVRDGLMSRRPMLTPCGFEVSLEERRGWPVSAEGGGRERSDEGESGMSVSGNQVSGSEGERTGMSGSSGGEEEVGVVEEEEEEEEETGERMGAGAVVVGDVRTASLVKRISLVRGNFWRRSLSRSASRCRCSAAARRISNTASHSAVATPPNMPPHSIRVPFPVSSSA